MENALSMQNVHLIANGVLHLDTVHAPRLIASHAVGSAPTLHLSAIGKCTLHSKSVWKDRPALLEVYWCIAQCTLLPGMWQARVQLRDVRWLLEPLDRAARGSTTVDTYG